MSENSKAKGSLYIRQGNNVQGPFPVERVRKWVAEGRIRPDMEFSADGSVWRTGGKWPLLFPRAPARRLVPWMTHIAAAVVGAAVALLLSPAEVGETRDRSTPAKTSQSTQSSVTKRKAARAESREQLRKRFLEWNRRWIQAGGQGIPTRTTFEAQFGKADRTRRFGGTVYWDYECSDGVLQFVLIAHWHDQGLVRIDEINDW